jgi:protein ImuB
MCSMTVACLLLPRLSLIAAAGERRELLRAPAALAPAPGREGLVGEASGAAEAHGVRSGMRLGEALARCPDLVLVPPDPQRADDLWAQTLHRLEELGAAVESERPGEAFFRADGLRGMYGGVAGTLTRARRRAGLPVRAAAAPGRFAAYAAALRHGGPRRTRRGATRGETVVSPSRLRDFLFPMPVSLLAGRLDRGGIEGQALTASLERLGIATLGRLARLPRDAVADRFGRLGLRAQALARGRDEPLRPRAQREPLRASLELPEAVAGTQLERALEMLIDRLLADLARDGRVPRSLRLGARLAGGGAWRSELVLRRPSASRDLLRVALSPRLAQLPGPASTLVLEATALADAGCDQLELSPDPGERRRELLADAVRQVQAAAGMDALLRAVDVEPATRVPERRILLTPFGAT